MNQGLIQIAQGPELRIKTRLHAAEAAFSGNFRRADLFQTTMPS
jgi:hypothetical protein